MKGRPPLEPRIAAIEKRLNIYQVNNPLEDAFKRIASLERRIAEMNEAFSHARFPRAAVQEQHGFSGKFG